MVCRQRFQSTLPRGERQKTQPKHVRDNRFQSTLPRGERHHQNLDIQRRIKNFNPRSREGSDDSIRAISKTYVNFNPRSREGSDAIFRMTMRERIGFQSTLPRGERPPWLAYWLFQADISIHAPARGATIIEVEAGEGYAISIHAPARGATIEIYPEFRKGEISIHAPARGATTQMEIFTMAVQFQSTLPRGERRWWRSCGRNATSISIHAPARGATKCVSVINDVYDISIHAPARGATFYILFYVCITTDFNPRSREGSDVKKYADSNGKSISIHAPARGAT